MTSAVRVDKATEIHKISPLPSVFPSTAFRAMGTAYIPNSHSLTVYYCTLYFKSDMYETNFESHTQI